MISEPALRGQTLLLSEPEIEAQYKCQSVTKAKVVLSLLMLLFLLGLYLVALDIADAVNNGEDRPPDFETSLHNNNNNTILDIDFSNVFVNHFNKTNESVSKFD